MAASEQDALDLLLADADSFYPVLEDGLPDEISRKSPKPKEQDTFDRRRDDDNPNDLTVQRWGVVAPEGPEGDRLLEAIAPLLKLREEEQGAAMIPPYRVPPGMDAEASLNFRDEIYWSSDDDEDDRPLYLLFLGDPHQVSLEAQHVLTSSALVGRVQFSTTAGKADLDGYAAYAEKVVRFAREGTRERSPDLLFFVANDGTSATIHGQSRLVTPALEDATLKMEKGQLPAASAREIKAGTVDALLAAGAGARPSVLLSVSHGLGAPRRGWTSKEEQWQRQGALVVGQGELLDAERIQGTPFLPGGLWFCLACFGAGTPATSAYHTWLVELAKVGAYRGQAQSVLESLPTPGQRPFTAAMPQAALRNPAGPLAVIGHMDLAWTYAFSSATNLSESRIERINEPLRRMVRGSRAGIALDGLMRSYRETNDTLMKGYELAAQARVAGQPDPTDYKTYGHKWMLRNDLRGYVLLGDPAVRLPLRQNTLRKSHQEAAPSPPEIRSPAPAAVLSSGRNEQRDAVLAVLRGASKTEIAAWHGVTLAELRRWVDTFLKAGTDALAKLDRS